MLIGWNELYAINVDVEDQAFKISKRAVCFPCLVETSLPITTGYFSFFGRGHPKIVCGLAFLKRFDRIHENIINF